MIGENINIGNENLRILIAPLDWGLGHATRIITIVKILQNYGAQVLIGAEGPIAALLQKEFPSMQILPLKGYQVKYSRRKKNFFFKLLQQLPGILFRIGSENRWLLTAVEEHNIDAVISDNRFGFYHKGIPSVYITHQLFIETGNQWMNTMAQKIHYKFINNFTECWVPDFENEENLAGILSHPKKMPGIPVKYLGPLSRFKEGKESIITNELLIILSGPEPQRTIWEEALLKQVQKLPNSVVLVRGKPGSKEIISTCKNLIIYNHLPAGELSNLIRSSGLVISRCGYSTVMDLVALNKKAILVATPGQAEQEYLAGYLKEKKLFYTCRQEGLQLNDAISKAHDFPQQKLIKDFTVLNEKVISDWVNRLLKRI